MPTSSMSSTMPRKAQASLATSTTSRPCTPFQDDKKPRHPSPFKGGQDGGAFLISSFLTHVFRAENPLSCSVLSSHIPLCKGGQGDSFVSTLARWHATPHNDSSPQKILTPNKAPAEQFLLWLSLYPFILSYFALFQKSKLKPISQYQVKQLFPLTMSELFHWAYLAPVPIYMALNR